MKILSRPEGDGLLTNAEVGVWLREKNFQVHRRDLKKGDIRPPSSTASITRDVRQYIDTSPAGNETVESVNKMFGKLAKFKLSTPELLMIANIRPDAYAHLTPLIVDCDSRFDEDQLYVILGIVNETLPNRPKTEGGEEVKKGDEDTGFSGAEDIEELNPGPVDDATQQLSETFIEDGDKADEQMKEKSAYDGEVKPACAGEQKEEAVAEGRQFIKEEAGAIEEKKVKKEMA